MLRRWYRVAPLALAIMTGAPFSSAVTSPAAGRTPVPAATSAAGGPALSERAEGSFERAVRTSEYALSWQPEPRSAGVPPAWQAPNRRNGFRAYFLPEGVRLVPRLGTEPGWSLGLSLAAYGCRGHMRPVSPADPEINGARVRYQRDGFEEWFANDDRGLEHGFTLGRAPGGCDCTVVFRLALAGTLVARPSGRDLEFAASSGVSVLRYAELTAFDAAGRTLPSRLVIGDGTIDLEVDVVGARYPVVIDPLVAAPEWLTRCRQDEAHLGLAVASAGDVNGDGFDDILAGAPFYDGGNADEGRVLLFLGGPTGLATKVSWAAKGNQENAHFGYALAGAGDVNGDGFADVVVGAPHFDSMGVDSGRVSLFLGSRTGLGEHPAWSADGEQAEAYFGASVAGVGDIDGDRLADVAVGAPGAGQERFLEGRAYLFLGAADGLSRSAAWTGVGKKEHAHFGHSVAGAGDVDGDGYADLVIGAPYCARGDGRDGRAFLYRGGKGGASREPLWIGEGGQTAALFGISVAGAGDVNRDGYSDIVVGASCFDGGEVNEGRAYLFLGGADGPSPEPQWSVESDRGAAHFGWSVAGAGDVNGDGYADVVIGARDFPALGSGGGRATMYHGTPHGLAPRPAWSMDGSQPGGHLGWSVASAGDVNGDGNSDVVVGEPFADLDGEGVGCVHVLFGTPTGMAVVSHWAFEGGQDGAELGTSLAGVGDVNGDGFDDLLVGAPGFDAGETDEGRAFLFLGSEGGLDGKPSWTSEGNRPGARFGAALCRTGDLDSDGYADFAVGAPGYGGRFAQEGRVFVFSGSPSGPGAQPSWTAAGNRAGVMLGGSVAAADLDGDRHIEVIAGAPGAEGDGAAPGFVLVFKGSANGPGPEPSWTLPGIQGHARFGAVVARLGDTDADGYGDLAVAAPGLEGRDPRPGLVALFRGSPTGPDPTPSWTVKGAAGDTNLGVALSGGDVDRDGHADLVVGVPGYDGSTSNQGAVFLFRGSPSGPSAEPGWSAFGGHSGTRLGSSVAAGDMDGDGHTDILVGTIGLPCARECEGGVLVFRGCRSGLGREPAWTSQAVTPGDRFGAAVAGAGDLNHDGFEDAVVGAPGFDGNSVDEGRTYAFLGSTLGLTGGCTGDSVLPVTIAAPTP